MPSRPRTGSGWPAVSSTFFASAGAPSLNAFTGTVAHCLQTVRGVAERAAGWPDDVAFHPPSLSLILAGRGTLLSPRERQFLSNISRYRHQSSSPQLDTWPASPPG